MSSSDEEDPNMKPDKEKGMYTKGMDPKAGPVHLTSSEAMRQRVYASATRAAGLPELHALNGRPNVPIDNRG
jgi:hypothetical protein